MNGWQKSALAIAMALSTLACDGSSEDPTQTRASDVKQETKEAIETTQDYVADRRRALEDQASQALQQVDQSIEEAREIRRDLQQEVEQLGEQGAATWEVSRQRLADALREAEEAQKEIAAALTGSGEAEAAP
jgi:predicted DNA-binding protein (UPF0251 family)